METKKYDYTIVIKGERFFTKFDVSYNKPITQDMKRKIYGIMYEAYGFNAKGKPLMLKIEITETKGGNIA
jgi:hypothetical protein